MKKTGNIIAIILLCLASGYVIGTVIGKSMNGKAESGYIGAAGAAEGNVLTPEIMLTLGQVSDPQPSPDGKLILYGVTYTDINANHGCRNLFCCAPDGSGNIQLSRYAKSVSNARWSLDGKTIFFIQDSQIWKAPFLGKKLGKKVKVSDVPAGISEFKLSPDQNSIIYVSSIRNEALKQPADCDPALNKANAYVTEDLMYRHWDHWVTETPRSFVAPFAGAMITPENSYDILGSEPYELPTEPFSGIEQLDWAPDSRHIAYSCRKKTGIRYAFSTNSCIYIHDIVTGQTTAVTEKGGYDTDPLWSPDGSKLAWISMARDGYEADAQRIMVADVKFAPQCEDGQCGDVETSGIRQLAASLDRDAAGMIWTSKSDAIVFPALTEGIQSLFIAGTDPDNSEAVRLTPADWKYDISLPFSVEMAEDGSFNALALCQSLLRPKEIFSISGQVGGTAELKAVTDENGAIFAGLDEPQTESVWIGTVDGKQMQAWVMYPPHFDPAKTYPAIEIVLGGPQGSNSQSWSQRWCYRIFAQHGYVVVMPNRRGTTSSGQEWKEQISGDYCGLNMQDYLSAGRWIKEKPYIGKLACIGASYGGYSAYMLEGLHGDLYDCFIAHAGIFDEKQLWFTTEEMWFANWDNGGLTEYAYTEGQSGPAGDGITFGGMQQAGAPYAVTAKAQRHYANSPSSMITKWHTPILCIHGMLDYRIPYEQGMAAFNAAQMMGVPSKLIVFPEENHWILKPQNSVFWYRNVLDWMDKWTK